VAQRRFQVRGEVDLATADALEARLRVLAVVTADDVILDCRDLTFIDSIGIGVFVRFHRNLDAQGRELRVVNMSEHVRRPFDILGLTERLGIDALDWVT